MNKFKNPLENIRIASPCKADWEQMLGNERKRFCGECKLNVYNLSGMTSREAENLLIEMEGRLCIRFYKRADGTILTKDCPVGWQAIKHRASRMAAAVVSLLFGIFSGLGLTSFFSQSSRENIIGQFTVNDEKYRTMGVVAYQPTPKASATPKQTPELLMGDIAMPEPMPKQKEKNGI
jgi:hypothetical protein